jgi:hypothetical protein
VVALNRGLESQQSVNSETVLWHEGSSVLGYSAV